MSNGDNPVWLYLGGGLLVAAIALFFFMGGSVDDIGRFVESPGATLTDIGGAAYESPSKGVFGGASALGDTIGGAMGGFGR